MLASAKAIKSWQQTLPETGDYQEHSVEIKIDGLPAGDYFLVLSDGALSKKSTTASASRVWVSNISYVNRGNDFFVLHRKTGEPLAGAVVKVLNKDYNGKLHKNVSKVLGRYTANNRGFFRVKGADIKSYSSNLSIAYNRETLAPDDDVYLNRNGDEVPRGRTERTGVYFFTDRSIYRPGQTVYFKAILVKDGGRQSKSIITHQAIIIYLHDANSQKLDSLKLTSNDYGSVAGQFVLPVSLLNGGFSLRCTVLGDDSRTSFSVEEYKRPKFYAAFDKVKEEYKIGDSVRLTLTAKAFAGNNVSGATVKYRVMRSNRMGWKYVERNDQQIVSGEKETDADGKLVISFKALPDESIDSTGLPVFNYTVTATVTDIAGETHSETETVSIGYASLLLTASVPDKLPLDSLKKLSVQTQNLQGERVQTPVIVTFFKLSPERRLLRNRFWERPDQYVMSKSEYIRYFPFDEYANESDYETWPKEKAGSFSTTTNDSSEISLQLTEALTAGDYLIQFNAKDKNGKEIKTEEHIELFSPQAMNYPEFLWTYADRTYIKSGEEHKLLLASAAQNIYLIKESDRSGKTLRDTTRFAYDGFSNEKKTYRFDAADADRGGYNYSFLFVKENRVYQYDGFVNVAWNNKDLQVSLTSFRDKTEPGTKETWKVKIKGDGGKAVAAEMLASMYDASLDEFEPHNWDKPYVWQTREEGLAWADEDFGTAESQEKEVQLKSKSYTKLYDKFLFDRREGILWWVNPLQYQYNGLLGYQGAYDTVAVNDLQDMSKVTSFKIVPRPIESAKFIENIKPVGQATPQKSKFYKRGDVEGLLKVMPGIQAVGNGVTDKYDPYDLDVQLQKKSFQLQPRKNLSETAFFFPFLTTDAAGDVEISFNAPEALTKWKLQAVAHTKDLAFGLTQHELITQKSLMVQPAVPRFVRQKDSFTLQAKIANLSTDELKGEASLQLFDAATNEPVSGTFNLVQSTVPFTAKGGGNTVVAFSVSVPEGFNSSLTWRITASAKGANNVSFTDGEEASLPVLPNKILLTETLPMVLKGTTTKELKLDKLLQSSASTTLQHSSLTIEATTNPTWYVVQALPYLMEFPYECAEQTWNRYYANALASVIVRSSPKIKAVFDGWKRDTTALQSALQKNVELKSALLQETPWVLEAQSEAAQKRNLALLFDEDRINAELRRNLAKLQAMQKSNGAFPWFSGGLANRYITQYILTGLGRLLNTKGIAKNTESEFQSILSKALMYLDNEVAKSYKPSVRYNGLSTEDAQYLYMRSFFSNYPLSPAMQSALPRLKAAAQKVWMKMHPQLQGMIALALYRGGDAKTAAAILASLKETAIVNDERGMYWKGMESSRGLYWEEAPVETAALLIETFAKPVAMIAP